ncbi:hypothetical protein Pcinc_016596 [Petrolisthes cinctipes]|uniref:Uncharacterized protein n=1 Tax=Petrolisthes cinctipes TaxID=88211 RepID=A0AAE1KQU5_PETCI|nr:hypothetical protein Pcinc_016596 [Petrolisthes cinctipes]
MVSPMASLFYTLRKQAVLQTIMRNASKDYPRDNIVNNKSTAAGIIDAKKKTWEEIGGKLNALYPDQHLSSTKQLKRKVKNEDRKFKSKIKVTGAGHPPTSPRTTAEIVQNLKTRLS